MNYSVVAKNLGSLLIVEAALLLIPALTGNLYGEKVGIWFLAVAAVAGAAGAALRFLIKTNGKKVRSREGFTIAALSWVILSLLGAVPFVLTGAIPSYTDAVFETASGFTTTGASILTDVEAMPRCVLMWRSLTHWIGGMGILVFILIFTPSEADSMHIMKAESPGYSVDKLVPKVKQTARMLYLIYIGLTLLEIILLLLGGMPLFDTICHAFGTAGTGGFGIKADSIGGYNTYCQVVITIFMLIFGTNFKLYFLLITKKFKAAFTQQEVIWYYGIYAFLSAVITVSIIKDVGSVWQSINLATFQAASVMTTTGFATADFDQWNTLAKSSMLLLMIIGACAGSTGGGIKVSRFLIYLKQIKREMQSLVHPRSVKKIKIDGTSIDEGVLKATNVFLMVYVMILAFSILIVSIDGFDMTSTITAIVATINNIGPGLGIVGPTGSYHDFSNLSKWVMIFDMIAGRLELFPMLVLFMPDTWKKR